MHGLFVRRACSYTFYFYFPSPQSGSEYRHCATRALGLQGCHGRWQESAALRFWSKALLLPSLSSRVCLILRRVSDSAILCGNSQIVKTAVSPGLGYAWLRRYCFFDHLQWERSFGLKGSTKPSLWSTLAKHTEECRTNSYGIEADYAGGIFHRTTWQY